MFNSEFKKSMDMQIENCSASVEKCLFQNYNATGNIMQEKLQELYSTLDRVCKYSFSAYNQINIPFSTYFRNKGSI